MSIDHHTIKPVRVCDFMASSAELREVLLEPFDLNVHIRVRIGIVTSPCIRLIHFQGDTIRSTASLVANRRLPLSFTLPSTSANTYLTTSLGMSRRTRSTKSTGSGKDSKSNVSLVTTSEIGARAAKCSSMHYAVVPANPSKLFRDQEQAG